MFQLGGPDSLEAVEPFLLNLFLDPDIIPLGPFGLLRRPIAKLISSRRCIPVAGKYGQIGGRSPPQRPSALSQRGANEQPGGNRPICGGNPGIVGIGPDGSLRRGIQRNNCCV